MCSFLDLICPKQVRVEKAITRFLHDKLESANKRATKWLESYISARQLSQMWKQAATCPEELREIAIKEAEKMEEAHNQKLTVA